MNLVVFSDRDGTINKDENYYLGSSKEWKNQVSFLGGVVDGIKLINNISNSHFFILTNQSGVALSGKDFDNLDLKRMHEVNKYIIEKLQNDDTKIDNYFACPYVDFDYLERARKKGRNVDLSYVKEKHPDLKPNCGMIEKALTSISLEKENCKIFVVGDRVSDVQMGLNIGGTGILIESPKTKELGDNQKILQLAGQTYIAKDFLDASEYIVREFYANNKL